MSDKPTVTVENLDDENPEVVEPKKKGKGKKAEAEVVEDRSAFNCPDCKGDGLKNQFAVCPTCNGTGKV